MIDEMDQIKVNYKIEATDRQLAIDFFMWWSELKSVNGVMMPYPRVVYEHAEMIGFVVIDQTGESILGEGVLLNHEQLFDYWFENIRTN